jgi:hypothetical protein
MKTLNYILLLSCFLNTKTFVSAQIMGQTGVYINGGFHNFNSNFLYNPNSANHKLSYFGQVGMQFPLHTWISSYTDIAYGNFRNMSSDFILESHSNYTGFGLGVILHTHDNRKVLKKLNRFEPYLATGYNFEYIYQNPQANYNKTISSVRINAGFWIRIADNLALGYRWGLNQRLGQDYRTYFSHNLGVLATLVRKEKVDKFISAK